MSFPYEQVCRVTRLRGDPAALGGAVTVALCGHWEHDGVCRWPHHTTTETDGDEVLVAVRFDAADGEVDEVRRLIASSLRTGTMVGPDGEMTRWQVVDASTCQ